MKIPDSWWSASIPFLLAGTAALNSFVAWSQSRLNAKLTQVHDKVEKIDTTTVATNTQANAIKTQTDGINLRLQDKITEQQGTIDKQASDAEQLAVVTDLKTKIVEAKHSPAE